MNVLFFDIVPTNIVRFFKDLVFELDLKCEHISFYFLLEENDHNDKRYVERAYPRAEKIDYLTDISVVSLKRYLLENKIDLLLINGQRIPDDFVVMCAKELGISCFMIQHGMYVPFLKRNARFFLRKIKKSIRYFIYSCKISHHLGFGYFGLTLKYINVYVFGENQVRVGIPRDKLNVDKVYVYGEYWKGFHNRQFGYTADNQLIVGYPDLNGVYDLKALLDSQNCTVCYIAQTLVEDGRLSRDVQVNFFKSLVDATRQNNCLLHVKLHPRSNRSLFNYASSFGHVSLFEDEFPVAKKYIGHYSTLLVKGIIISGDCCFYEYEGHPIPSYFKESASAIVSNGVGMQDWLRSETTVSDKNIIDYFKPSENAMGAVVQDIMKTLSKS